MTYKYQLELPFNQTIGRFTDKNRSVTPGCLLNLQVTVTKAYPINEHFWADVAFCMQNKQNSGVL